MVFRFDAIVRFAIAKKLTSRSFEVGQQVLNFVPDNGRRIGCLCKKSTGQRNGNPQKPGNVQCRQRPFSNALLGGTATNRLPMTVLFVSGPKCPHAQTASNDHCNPGNPRWYVDTSDKYRPLIQSPHSLKNGYHAEENT